MIPSNLSIRSYESKDNLQVVRLFVEGMNDTRITEEDRVSMSGYIDFTLNCGDMSDIEGTYFSDKSNPMGHFWVLTQPFDTKEIPIALDKEEIVGTIALQRISDEICELRRFSVKRTFRKQGIGIGLINYALQYGKTQGFKKCILQTDCLMKQGIALYLKCGFTHIRSIPWGIKDFSLEDFEISLVDFGCKNEE